MYHIIVCLSQNHLKNLPNGGIMEEFYRMSQVLVIVIMVKYDGQILCQIAMHDIALIQGFLAKKIILLCTQFDVR